MSAVQVLSSSSSSCPSVCAECPQEMPKCAPGVSVALDGCGCCKVCARQLNEDCSLTEPCDHTKGLECNFGASFAAATTRGICRGMYEKPIQLQMCMLLTVSSGFLSLNEGVYS